MLLHYGQVTFEAKPSFFMIVMQNTYSLGIFKWRRNVLTFAKLSPAFTFILRGSDSTTHLQLFFNKFSLLYKE